MTPFVEERLDMGYDRGAVGGPEFSTDIVEFGSGHEDRNANWDDARGRWELGEREIDRKDLDYLQAFFRARRGRAVGFRYRDWNDYRAQSEALAPDGTPTVQLIKTYASAGESQVREIRKPVAATVTLQRGGATFSAWSLDSTTGIVTLTSDWDAAIESLTQAAPAVVTITGHGRQTGDVLYITGTGTSLDDAAHAITVIDPDTFSVYGSDTSGDPAYSSGGTAEQYVQPSESLTWSGEFDVPVRFATDEFRARFEAISERQNVALYFLASLPVVEVRV
ncbi:DUF2460 domain-containing protein [Ectothiorhodospiraceae bacterium WFHF3C12]|nr:DUF2460 domain-containing protein [Ectothiorhodospiraceae bacterium WFHF3C12]